VDNETDEVLQRMVRERFQDCTTLTIAHRLNTVIDADKVLVMDHGRLAEFDAPQRLLQNEGGIFSSLWREHQSAHAH
jgi:ABC-type multidrug transport system fused ATPase/permease subunit